MPQQTYGQKMVGLSFNPSNDDEVAKVKQAYADIIDQLKDLSESTSSVQKTEFAQDAIKLAVLGQMLAVKAITWKD